MITACPQYACRLLCCAVLLAAFTGCAITYQPGMPSGMIGVEAPGLYAPRLAKLEAEGERNWVLNLNELAVQALRNDDLELAKQALDEAILLIEIVYGDSEQAQRARTLFFEEGSKIFKGDPYERSMTYFYRGVLYMNDRDWDNARACFRGATLQDAVAEEQQNQGDWALFDYLIGVCEAQLGRTEYAEEAFQRAHETYSGFQARYSELASKSASRLRISEQLPPFTPIDNLLVLAQTGQAPRKVATGAYGEFLAYEPGPGTGGRPDIFINGRPAGSAVVADSLYYQAVTRGGRELDLVLGRQAQFKGGSDAAGTAGIMVGAVVLNEGIRSHNDDQAAAGAILLAAGLIAKGFSELIRPKADVRAWTTLPDALGVWPAMLPAGQHEVAVVYANGKVSRTVDIPQPGAGLAVLLAFPPEPPYAPPTPPHERIEQ